ncbi:MAG: hypothetical protein IJD86_00860, partial [Clostridia bacterium]|nr:hypothetical protein [Clostridia bacterium]
TREPTHIQLSVPNGTVSIIYDDDQNVKKKNQKRQNFKGFDAFLPAVESARIVCGVKIKRTPL